MKSKKIILMIALVIVIFAAINIHFNWGQKDEGILLENIEALADGEGGYFNGQCWQLGSVTCPAALSEIKVRIVISD